MGGVLIALQALIANKRANAMDKTAQAQADAGTSHAREENRQKPIGTPNRGSGRSA